MDKQLNIDFERRVQEITKALSEGKTVQEVTGISPQLLEEIYELGYSYYNQGRYKEAVSLFYILVGFVPKNYKYTFALGAAYHQIEDYHHALLSFYMCCMNDSTQPLAAYFAADCLYKSQAFEECSLYLDLAIRSAGSHPDYASLKERSLIMKKGVMQEIQTKNKGEK